MALSNILIIEDEEYLRNLYSDLLGDYEVKTVNDGYNALKEKKKYDLYIVDIGLPGINGLETIEKLNNAHGEIRAIVVTGYDITKLANDKKNIHIDAFLQKPFKVFDLLNAVEKVLHP